MDYRSVGQALAHVAASADTEAFDVTRAYGLSYDLKPLTAPVNGRCSFSFASLLNRISKLCNQQSFHPPNLVLVGADNEDALTTVSRAKDYGLVGKVALIGSPSKVLGIIEQAGLPLFGRVDSDVKLIQTGTKPADSVSEKESVAAVFRAFIKDHPDFIVMKGNLDTASVLRGALSIYRGDSDSDNGDIASTRKIASFTSLFVLPDGRFVALSDPAVNPGFRDPVTLLRAIENLLDVVRKAVGPLPTLKVAIVTAIEKKTSAIPATLLAAEAMTRSEDLHDRYGPLVVEGPISLDLAMIPEVAKEKRYVGQIMGDANCLVAIDINTANVLYKVFSKILVGYGLSVDYGGIVTAGPGTSPISLTSRADSARIKFNSILVALAYSSLSGK